MATICKFVDSVVSVPTTRLDLNASPWKVTALDPGLPRLRRAGNANAMTDGIFVSSSSYDGRRLMITLVLNAASADANGTEIQKLARELDRTDNYLMYQPNGATKPVFFRTLRSDVAQLQQFGGGTFPYQSTIEVLAQPFALGLKESIGPTTVRNDPADLAGNGLFWDVTGVIGDVAADPVIVNASRKVFLGVLAARQHGTPSDMNSAWWVQAESCTLGTDTTNPGGGPDAAMSGTGVNNFVRTSFGTPAMTTRLTWVINPASANEARALRGRYNLFAVVRRSDASSVMTLQAGVLNDTTAPVTIPANTGRQLIALGLLSIFGHAPKTGHAPTENSALAVNVTVSAARASGAGTLDFDFLVLVPADESTMLWQTSGADAAADEVVDSVTGRVWSTLSGDPFAGTAAPGAAALVSGGFPRLVPNQTNRLFYLETGNTLAMVKGDSSAMTVHYWPQYLFVRPSAS